MPPLPASLAGDGIVEIRSQAAFFAEVHAFFVALAATRPTLVLLEDLHWADPASLDLLRHLACQLSPSPLLLIVTYRVDELTRRHPFYQQLPALIRDTGGMRMCRHRAIRPVFVRRAVITMTESPAISTTQSLDH